MLNLLIFCVACFYTESRFCGGQQLGEFGMCMTLVFLYTFFFLDKTVWILHLACNTSLSVAELLNIKNSSSFILPFCLVDSKLLVTTQ